MSSATRKPLLPPLTGLRYLAALLVVFFHARPLNVPEMTAMQRLVGRGYVGVGLFFVLSGFILAYTYLDGSSSPSIEAKTFWRARFARIYPVYVLGLLLGAPFLWRAWTAGHQSITAPLLLAPVFLQSWAPHAACPWNCPGWSLSAEAFFYLLFPLLAVWAARRTDRTLLWWMLAVWLVSLIAPALYIHFNPDGTGPGSVYDAGVWILLVKYNPALHVPAFLVGVLAGHAFLRGYGTKLSAWALPAFLAIVALLVSPLAIPHLLLTNGLLIPLFAMLIMALATGRGMLHRSLGSPVMVRLGEASYALYITHWPLLHAAQAVAKRTGMNYTSLGFRAGVAFGATLFALAAFRWIEEPMRNRLRGPRIPPSSAMPPSPTVSEARAV